MAGRCPGVYDDSDSSSKIAQLVLRRTLYGLATYMKELCFGITTVVTHKGRVLTADQCAVALCDSSLTSSQSALPTSDANRFGTCLASATPEHDSPKSY